MSTYDDDFDTDFDWNKAIDEAEFKLRDRTGDKPAIIRPYSPPPAPAYDITALSCPSDPGYIDPLVELFPDWMIYADPPSIFDDPTDASIGPTDNATAPYQPPLPSVAPTSINDSAETSESGATPVLSTSGQLKRKREAGQLPVTQPNLTEDPSELPMPKRRAVILPYVRRSRRVHGTPRSSPHAPSYPALTGDFCRKSKSSESVLREDWDRHPHQKNLPDPTNTAAGEPCTSYCAAKRRRRDPLKFSGRPKSFPCTVEGCRQVCHSAGDLRRHMQTLAHNDRQFVCLSCGNFYTREDALKRHHQNVVKCKKSHFALKGEAKRNKDN